MKLKGSRRLIRQLGLALAVAAVAAPAAQAMPMVSSEDNGVASQARLYADDVHAVVTPQHVRSYADDRHASVTPVSVRLYADDRHPGLPVSDNPGNYEPINTLARPDLIQTSAEVAPADATGFDWNDAGIGAVTVFGLMLLAGAVLLAGRHSRKSRLAAA